MAQIGMLGVIPILDNGTLFDSWVIKLRAQNGLFHTQTINCDHNSGGISIHPHSAHLIPLIGYCLAQGGSTKYTERQFKKEHPTYQFTSNPATPSDILKDIVKLMKLDKAPEIHLQSSAIKIFMVNPKNLSEMDLCNIASNLINANSKTSPSFIISSCFQIVCGLFPTYLETAKKSNVVALINLIQRQTFLQEIAQNYQSTASSPPIGRLYQIALIFLSIPAKGFSNAYIKDTFTKRFRTFCSTVKVQSDAISLKPVFFSILGDAISSEPDLLRCNTTWVKNAQPTTPSGTALLSQCRMLLRYGGLQMFKMMYEFIQNDQSEVLLFQAICKQGEELEIAWDNLHMTNDAEYSRMMGMDNDAWNVNNYPDILQCVKIKQRVAGNKIPMLSGQSAQGHISEIVLEEAMKKKLNINSAKLMDPKIKSFINKRGLDVKYDIADFGPDLINKLLSSDNFLQKLVDGFH